VVQVSSGARGPLSITLQRRAASPDDPPQVLAAGVGPLEPPRDDEIEEPDDHDHAEVAWRLRHSRRSVLKEATGNVDFGQHELGQPEAVLAGLGWAVDGSARLASALLPDLDGSSICSPPRRSTARRICSRHTARCPGVSRSCRSWLQGTEASGGCAEP
jgi:hypothetical protein